MQLYFIRHGQSQNNAIWDETAGFDGKRLSDPALTPKGVLQAQLAGHFLGQQSLEIPRNRTDVQNRNGFGLTHLYCSLMERAIQTGVILSEVLQIPLVGVPELHEVGGIYLETLSDGLPVYSIEHGLLPGEIQARYPSLKLSGLIDDKGWWRGGREERNALLPRACRIVEMLKDRHAGTEDRVGIITHGGIFSYLFRVLFHIEVKNDGESGLPFQVILNNCGISRFDLNEEGTFFLYHNRTDFLPDELVT